MKLTVAIVGVVVMCWTASAAYPNPVPQTTHRLVGNLSSVSTSAPLRHPTFLDGMAHDVDMHAVIMTQPPYGVVAADAEFRNVNWNTTISQGYIDPTIPPTISADESKVFVGTSLGVIALNISNGAELWLSDAGSFMGGESEAPSGPALSVADKTVFVSDGVQLRGEAAPRADSSPFRANVSAIDTDTGHTKWRRTPFSDGSACGHVPVLSRDGKFVYTSGIRPDGVSSPSVVKLRANDGATVWERNDGLPLWLTAPAMSHDGKTMFHAGQFSFIALSTETGRTVWNVTAPCELSATPVLSSDGALAFISCHSDNPAAFIGTVAVRTADGKTMWQRDHIAPLIADIYQHPRVSSPALGHNGAILYVTGGGIMEALETSSGRPTFVLGDSDHPFEGSDVFSGGFEGAKSESGYLWAPPYVYYVSL